MLDQSSNDRYIITRLFDYDWICFKRGDNTYIPNKITASSRDRIHNILRGIQDFKFDPYSDLLIYKIAKESDTPTEIIERVSINGQEHKIPF